MEKLFSLRLTTAVTATVLVLLVKVPSANQSVNLSKNLHQEIKIMVASNLSDWKLFEFQPKKRGN
ncbi:hypothetical protein [Oscillatoria salina]|uniref:hypothetical protein n=1 Tax=Oscillatoria salina TaxID=331517 RepID=UPI0013BDCF69|nr:hypothetical protein [Oscillatoria salina]MBZ8182234.1 hypothetical protein [Oscillatoria salina IIICB1]NET91144.1 hypothetical protein [Kamptonema sp. SIO1D9]